MGLTNKELMGADLRGYDLYKVDLSGANLSGADLSGANLHKANLFGAILKGTNLSRADLRETHLRMAYLLEANLFGANLTGADLGEANLYGANLIGADLSEVNIIGAYLDRTYLNETTNMPVIPFACPAAGSFIGYKKAFDYARTKSYIVKLQILDDSKRSSATSSKCRCDKAKVLAIENMDGSLAEMTRVNSWHDIDFNYEVGKIVQADNYDENRWHECSGGIHFFVNRDEAVVFNL